MHLGSSETVFLCADLDHLELSLLLGGASFRSVFLSLQFFIFLLHLWFQEGATEMTRVCVYLLVLLLTTYPEDLAQSASHRIISIQQLRHGLFSTRPW